MTFESFQVYGTKDSDGFYWGEVKGRRGYVPHNMVVEVEDASKVRLSFDFTVK